MVSSLSGTGELDDVIPGFCIRNWSVGLLSPSLAAAPFGHANPIGLLQDRQNMQPVILSAERAGWLTLARL
jgi:hypothetical protein